MRFLVAGLCGGVLFLVLSLVVWCVLFRSTLAPIDREHFDQSWKRWRESNIQNYDLQLTTSSSEDHLYDLKVRDGAITSVALDGEARQSGRAFQAFTIDGMFEIIDRDLSNNEQIEAGNVQQGQAVLSLRGEFDSENGYPKRFLRFDPASRTDASWQIEAFEAKF